MDIKERVNLISGLTAELTASTNNYAEVRAKKTYVNAGCDVSMFDSKTAIQRRITVLREELLELSKML